MFGSSARRALSSPSAPFAHVPRRTYASSKLKHDTKFADVVLVDGVRTPFQMSGTGYKTLQSYELQQFAFEGLLKRTGLNPAKIDNVIAGTVIQEVKTSNIAREAALLAGVPQHIPAHTVTLACISSNVAIANAINLIKSGQADIVMAGGAETMSDVPIRFSRAVRARMLASQKIKSPAGYLGLLQGLKLKDLAPELPAVAEFSTGETMGFSADRLSATYNVSRAEQDEFAVRSHTLAAKAAAAGYLKDIIPVELAKGPVTTDNGVRGDSSIDKLSKLKPAFVKPHGTITAGNASFLTDGASAALIMSKERALKEGFKPLAYLRDYTFVAGDPKEELLLGPAYAVAKLLDRNGLKMTDIDVWELHEAFAGQVLANLNALDSEKFASDNLKRAQGKIGRLPMDKINNWGGSLSLGHPFGATGVRIVTAAANRLIHENKELAMVAACAAGGQAHGIIVERYT